MNGIERMTRQLNHQSVDRIAVSEEFWGLTVPHWVAEGKMKQGESVIDHFNMDMDTLWTFDYTLVKDACRRLMGTQVEVTGHILTWDMIPFDVQLIGAIALHQNNIAEMATGEGKTLVAVMPLYLNALTGRNVQLVTVNDYLARRDSEWMGHVLKWLGITVGCIQNSMNSDQRREQYNCDVTYGTNSEFGFDYLNDEDFFHDCISLSYLTTASNAASRGCPAATAFS